MIIRAETAKKGKLTASDLGMTWQEFREFKQIRDQILNARAEQEAANQHKISIL
jgi:hypothetical protein